jgi:hypothetical protein
MPDSTFVEMANITSPLQPAPAPPTVGAPTWAGLTATFPVTVANEADIQSIKYKFGPTGTDPATMTEVTVTGPFTAEQVVPVSIVVPNWNTAYDFYFADNNG